MADPSFELREGQKRMLGRSAPLTPMQKTPLYKPFSLDSLMENKPQNVALDYSKKPGFSLYSDGRDMSTQDYGVKKKKPVEAPVAQAPVDPYANGGDGRVAREERPRNQQVSVAGGVPRDELIRRMEIAARSYAGSPSARQAMMGAYAEQLKAYDTVEINNNNNNNQNDQLTFQQNSSANRQEAQGRQEFGNEVGMLNRRLDAESALAAQTAKANAPMNELQARKIESEIKVNEGNALINAKKGDQAILASADAPDIAFIKDVMEKDGLTRAQAETQLANNKAQSGNLDTSTTLGRRVINNQYDKRGEDINKGMDYISQAIYGGSDVNANLWADPGVAANTVLDANNTRVEPYTGSGLVSNVAAGLHKWVGKPLEKVSVVDPETGKVKVDEAGNPVSIIRRSDSLEAQMDAAAQKGIKRADQYYNLGQPQK